MNKQIMVNGISIRSNTHQFLSLIGETITRINPGAVRIPFRPAFHKRGRSGMKALRVCRNKDKHDQLFVGYQTKSCLIHGIYFHSFDTLKKVFLF